MNAHAAGYKPQLDSLRAFAIAIVMVHHFLPVERIIPEDYITLGFIGVRLFFVLSGFLITGILLRGRGQSDAWASFYSRRILRIFPIYYLALAVCFIFSATMRGNAGWLLTYTSNLAYPFQSFGPASHFWTLGVEEQFYLVWPLVILLAPYRHLLKFIIGAIVIAIVFRLVATAMGQQVAGGVWPFGCFDSLALGALLALFGHDRKLEVYRESFIRSSAVGGLFLLIGLTVLYALKVGGIVIATLLCFAASLVFVALVAKAADGMKGRIKLILEWAPVLYIGRISYGLYVYHNFMPPIIKGFVGSPTTIPGHLAFAAIATAMTLAIAIFSWHMIEKPILHLKRTDLRSLIFGL